jgi:hypothetical protein
VASLDSVRLKIAWADKHLKFLVAEMDRYFKTDPCHIVTDIDPATNLVIETRFVQERPLPPDIPLIVGDCVQNLRTALDYLIWELVLVAGNSPSEKNAFPVCASRKAFQKAIERGLLSGVSDEAIAEVEALQPYHGGNGFEATVIWVMNQIANINKHRRLLTTVFNPGFSRDSSLGAFGYGQSVITPHRAQRVKEISITGRTPEQMEADAYAVVNIVINEGRLKKREVINEGRLKKTRGHQRGGDHDPMVRNESDSEI